MCYWQLQRKYIYDEIFHAPEWTLMDLGDITNDEAIEIINKRNEFKYEKLTQEFLHEWYKKQPINRDIVEIAKILKNNGYNLFVLSNMANQTYEYFKNDEFFSLCTGIVISAHEHVKKPDEKVYRLLLDRFFGYNLFTIFDFSLTIFFGLFDLFFFCFSFVSLIFCF